LWNGLGGQASLLEHSWEIGDARPQRVGGGCDLAEDTAQRLSQALNQVLLALGRPEQ
jgi:hypothetical protein